jgi:dTDP-4-amino-4,6-dideoxygalactose transaminase
MKNFLIKQYQKDIKKKISHNYLPYQFKNSYQIFKKIKLLIKNCDFTLGKEVIALENNFKKLTKTKYAFGVGSGTDAMFLSLRALDLKKGDEVITTSFTFYSTVGAIVTAGGTPVFIDIGNDLNINPDLIEKKITKKTKALLIVHWAGKVCDMEKILKISKKYKIPIIEDACHAIGASFKNKSAGSFGLSGCFSFHPLKNLNVWGDGGVLCTNNKAFAKKIYLLRNHGLVSRNRCKIFGYNSRLDTIQAIVANYIFKNRLKIITKKRILNSNYLDEKLKNNKDISLPVRSDKNSKEVFHLYHIFCKKQKKLVAYLNKKGIDAKIHYPIPVHKQQAAKKYIKKGLNLVNTDRIVRKIISLPVHEYVKIKDLDFIIESINFFYKNENSIH